MRMTNLSLSKPTRELYQTIYGKVRQFEARFYQIADELRSSLALDTLQHDYSGSYPALPTKSFMLAKFIEQLQTVYYPFTFRVLDLGAASGRTLGTLVSLLGIEGAGIEARMDAYTTGKAVLGRMDQEGWFGKNNCKLYLGNYFPAHFIIDDEIKWGRDAPTINRRSEKDVYNEIGLSISDFDLIWAYQYLANLHSTATLIGQRAAPGTLVVFPGTTLEEIKTPSNITQVYRSESGVIGRVR